MLRFILKFVAVFATLASAGAVQKPIFLTLYGDNSLNISDYLQTVWHGLAMDCTVAGYLSAIPFILMTAGIWTGAGWLKITRTVYFAVASILMALTAVANLGLYGHWGFPLDMTPVFYFTSSPAAAAASATAGEAVSATIGLLIYAATLFTCLYLIDRDIRPDVSEIRGRATIVGIIMTGLLFIPIRGGFTVSTMNPGRAYFSQRTLLNHAAVNPAFSLLYSATHQADFGKMFRYLDPEASAETFRSMMTKATTPPDTIINGRPDIYLVIAESFSSHLLPVQGGEAIAVRLDSIARNGVIFDNFYASSFRTDRALPAILGAIPGQPNTSLMKYPGKSEGLPSLPRALKEAGYKLKYYYGGDINFTNMKAYLVNCGFEDIVSDRDFPMSERTGKWGAHDHLVFRHALSDAQNCNTDAPQLRVIQTSSSHEPFEVPFRSHHSTPAANAFAYADSCIGDFADSLALLSRPYVMIIVPDHWGSYPKNLTGEDERHQIPLILSGNALTGHGIHIDRYGSQTDLAATLLGQLGIDNSKFVFSRDMLSELESPFAFYTSPNTIALTDSTGTAFIDIATGNTSGDNAKTDKAKAYIQELYNYLDSL